MRTKTANTGTKPSRSPVEATTSGPGLGVASLIYSLLSMAYFLPAFLPGRHLFGTDYLAGGYFFFEFVSERLAAGELPKWVPYIYGGLPLSANPGSTFYPVRLLADFLFPTTWILPFIFVFQFAVAGIGMYLLARELGSRNWVALVAGLAFQFTGITTSWVFAGHDGRVIVATFAPLFFFFLHQAVRTGAFASFLGAAATIGFSLLSFQIQNNYYLLIAGAIWAVFCLVHLGVVRDRPALVKRVVLGLSAVAFGFVLAAVNFLPFLDYVPMSPRGAEGGRGYEYSISFSMPPEEILSAAVPEQAGILANYAGRNPFKLHTEYVGAPVLVLLVLGFAYSRASRYWWFFGGLGLFALTIALGGYTPLYRLFYALLPGTARFRAPSLSYFIVVLSLVTMAAITLEHLMRARETAAGGADRKTRETTRAPTRLLVGILGAVVLGLVVASASAGSSARDAAAVAGWGRFAFVTAAACGAIWLWWSDRIRARAFAIALAVLTVADLWVIGRNFFETVPPPEVTFAPDDVVRFLSSQPQPNRVWVLPFPAGAVYRDHGNYLMRFGIAQAGGEHGNQLQRYNEFVGAGEDVYVDWHNFLSSPNFLNAANIRYLVTLAELEIPDFVEVHRGSAIVYENTAALPRAYLASDVVATPDTTAALEMIGSPGFDVRRTAVVYGSLPRSLPEGELSGTAEVTEFSPDRVVVRTTASRDALLVLADNYFPGWRAAVNGVEAPILRTNHTFRGVIVPSGDAEVVFEFRPSDFYLGFYIYLIGLALLAGSAVWLLVVRRRRDDSITEAPA